jgi:hypothetical protein
MTLIAAHVRVLNSLLFIKDGRTDELPSIDGNGSVWFNASCIAVSCLPDCDGITEIVVGDLPEAESVGGKLAFVGQIDTPSRVLTVQTVVGKKLLEREVPGATTHVRVWTNGARDTDKVIIGLR